MLSLPLFYSHRQAVIVFLSRSLSSSFVLRLISLTYIGSSIRFLEQRDFAAILRQPSELLRECCSCYLRLKFWSREWSVLSVMHVLLELLCARGSGCRSGNRRLQVHRRTRRGHSNALALERLCTASPAALHRQSKSLRVVINLEISRLTTLQASRIVKMGVGSDSPAAAAGAASHTVAVSCLGMQAFARGCSALLPCFPRLSLSLSLVMLIGVRSDKRCCSCTQLHRQSE